MRPAAAQGRSRARLLQALLKLLLRAPHALAQPGSSGGALLPRPLVGVSVGSAGHHHQGATLPHRCLHTQAQGQGNGSLAGRLGAPLGLGKALWGKGA